MRCKQLDFQLYSYESVREIVLLPSRRLRRLSVGMRWHSAWLSAFPLPIITWRWDALGGPRSRHGRFAVRVGLKVLGLPSLCLCFWVTLVATGEISKTDCGECECLLISSLKRYACSANVIASRSGPTGQPVRMTYFPLPLKSVFVPHPRDQSSGVIVSFFLFFFQKIVFPQGWVARKTVSKLKSLSRTL